MIKRIKNVKIGADIEVFLKDASGKYISAIGLIGGTKDNPRSLGIEGHAVQEDNVAAEFNIPPARTAKEFIDNINTSLIGLLNLLPSNLSIDLHSSATFDDDQLIPAMAKEFGCSPDYNAYTLAENKKPCLKDEPNLRCIGGHIHVGYDNPSMTTNVDIIHQLDFLLGIPSLVLDDDTNRRKLYGKAGSFRPKPYGVEFRTLSSFWIAENGTMEWIFNAVQEAVERINNDNLLTSLCKEKVQQCINGGNTEMAKQFVNVYKIAVPESSKEKFKTKKLITNE